MSLESILDPRSVIYFQGKTKHWLLRLLNGVVLRCPQARFWHMSWLTTLVPAMTLKLTQEGGGPVGLDKMTMVVTS